MILTAGRHLQSMTTPTAPATTPYDRVSIEEMNPTGWEDFTDWLLAGRPVCNAPGGSDTIPCPPPADEDDDLPF